MLYLQTTPGGHTACLSCLIGTFTTEYYFQPRDRVAGVAGFLYAGLVTSVYEISTKTTLQCCDMYIDFTILLLILVVDSSIRFSDWTVVSDFLLPLF